MNHTIDNQKEAIRFQKQEIKAFIGILSDFISCRKTTLPEYIDWSIIAKLSRIHQVEGIVYYQCKEFIPEEIFPVSAQAFAATLFYYKNRECVLSSIKREFEQNGIHSFEVKGMRVAEFYPIPALRTMGDSDIVVHKEQMEKANDLLLMKGFSNTYNFINKESGYSYHGINIEIHYQLVYDEVVSIAKQKAFFNDCWDYVRNGELDHSFHFLFLIVHLRKHMMNDGAGFRQFLDIATVAKNDPLLDWGWIAEKLEYLDLLQFAKTCFGLIECWFGIQAPMEYPKVDQMFLDKASRRIAENGVFGFNDKSNSNNGVYNQLINYKGPRWMGRLLIVKERMFPSYEFLRVGENYAFLDGKPWLLPAAWCRRFHLMIKGETTGAHKIIEKTFASEKEIDQRIEELRQWGLVSD